MIVRLLLLIISLGWLPAAQANFFSDEPEILPQEQVFIPDLLRISQNQVKASFTILPGYYLYDFRFKATVSEGSQIQPGKLILPPGKPKKDDFFGEFNAYLQEVDIIIPFSGAENKPIKFTLHWQGCAEAGFCYPPASKTFELDKFVGVASEIALANTNYSLDQLSNADDLFFSSQLADSSLSSTLLIFFLIGIGLAFTPCVFPMMPILAGLIAGGNKKSFSKTLVMSLMYVQGMAVAYAVIGLVFGLAGANLQSALQHPVVLIVFSVIFVILALGMFGFYQLQMPAAIQAKLQQIGDNGSLLGAFVMGLASALIASPCVTPALTGALLYISTQGDASTGMAALYAMGIGMGIPLIVLAIGGNKLMPKSGNWMDKIKVILGFGLLGVAVWLISRLISDPTALVLWGILLVLLASQLGLEKSDTVNGRFRQGIAILILLWGGVMVTGGALGNRDPLAPLTSVPQTYSSSASNPANSISITADHANFKDIRGLDALLAEVGNGQPVMLDFYADWCVSCKVMERDVFPDPQVQQALQGYKLLRSDVTANDAIDQGLMSNFGVIAPPTLLFFDANGMELRQFRITGEKDREQFLSHLKKLNSVL
ncbi:protein-disulfide reductase DsbD [Pelagibaculum spongiae]|uniref:Thiol:disulfide interchange protein DsbD n=1 Tax=Pelagibaculum spongiae TaxID=2080658 RepID=A0A2V1GSE3_9GAMM|nr:protein-disulfide reductase DsbD [Pelagibaculum spongiae]PVZ66276.1 thiol:disulfide interchange protein [Pelagibaculum spongiae]